MWLVMNMGLNLSGWMIGVLNLRFEPLLRHGYFPIKHAKGFQLVLIVYKLFAKMDGYLS